MHPLTIQRQSYLSRCIISQRHINMMMKVQRKKKKKTGMCDTSITWVSP